MSSAGCGHAIVPPLATPPPPVESSDEEDEDDESTNNVIDSAMDAKFMADAEQEAEEERAAHTAFDAEMERRREAAAAEDDSSLFDWSSDDGADPKEKAAEQRALVESFETLKKSEDVANETLRQRLLEDATTHRALAVARWAAEKLRREGGNDGAGPSAASS